MAIWNLGYKESVRILADVHTKSIRNAIWSDTESEIVSVGFDQSCALTDAESGWFIYNFFNVSWHIWSRINCDA
jgi:hypothetical protein